MGRLIKNGVIYGAVGGDNSKTISYQEYLNLPEEEKMNGTTYYIPDANIGGGSVETTVEVVDNLESTDTEAALSANMGRQLSESLPIIDGSIVEIGEIISKNIADVDVTFNKTFTKIPIITCTLVSNSTGVGIGSVSCVVLESSISTTGFTIRVYNNDTSNRTPRINWMAVQF